ncbi:SHOCT domain-containing protein [Actinoplanes oblitus]|uniref:SHOCT domain-containing protein n=1 Tax=Actinoplanes oblitus TaxID=3040509 RepID=A0ABY8W919_9ACTN|nr:SHOCT domain-containing protein [Actinoplanes oblitus]WIM92938.1 SHOCT domain-containing protein [Actinoplanes oblitus]
MMYGYPHFMTMAGPVWFLILAVLLLIAVVGALAWWPSRREDDSSAEKTLADRYAHGDIDTEEYQERLRTLHSVHH